VDRRREVRGLLAPKIVNTYMSLSCLQTVGIDSNRACVSITLGFHRTRGAQAITSVASEVDNKARAAQIRGCCSEEKVHTRRRAAGTIVEARSGKVAAEANREQGLTGGHGDKLSLGSGEHHRRAAAVSRKQGAAPWAASRKQGAAPWEIGPGVCHEQEHDEEASMAAGDARPSRGDDWRVQGRGRSPGTKDEQLGHGEGMGAARIAGNREGEGGEDEPKQRQLY
jgi:hypothetical protein